MSTSTVLDVRPLTPVIGGRICGLEGSRRLSDEVVEQLHVALAEQSVVFLRGLDFDVDAHLQLARQLGAIKMPSKLLSTLASDGYPEIGVITTEGGHRSNADQWHTDVTWEDRPPRYSILHMQDCPDVGGDTMWSSQYAAYDALSEPMKAFLAGLTARHQPGHREFFADHPVVCRNPGNGRAALFVNRTFTRRILELDEAESTALLDMLCTHAARPEFTCRWRWQPGDVAIWNNLYVQHYAIDDYFPALRRIHRIEIEGDRPIPAESSA